MLPQRISLSAHQLRQIDACLTQLRREVKALLVLLADISGQLIEEQGVDGHINAAVLSALTAGEMAATREMARLVGQQARFKMMLHEGDTRTVYLSDVDEEMILITVCDNSTPIGLLRFHLREAVARLQQILQESRAQEVEREDNLAASLDQLIALDLNALL